MLPRFRRTRAKPWARHPVLEEAAACARDSRKLEISCENPDERLVLTISAPGSACDEVRFREQGFTNVKNRLGLRGPFESRYSLIVWLDAFALAVAVPAGAGLALEAGVSPVVVVAMGVVTGTFGGLIRDVVGNELPMVLKQKELYVTAAFGGALVGVALIGIGMPRPMALIFCGLIVIALRAGSLLLGWSLPTYRARPPRR